MEVTLDKEDLISMICGTDPNINMQKYLEDFAMIRSRSIFCPMPMQPCCSPMPNAPIPVQRCARRLNGICLHVWPRRWQGNWQWLVILQINPIANWRMQAQGWIAGCSTPMAAKAMPRPKSPVAAYPLMGCHKRRWKQKRSRASISSGRPSTLPAG